MKHVWKMLMAALLACMLLLPASAMADTLYGVANQNDVPMQSMAQEGAYTVFTVDKGHEFTIVDTIVDDDAQVWYMVHCESPIDQVTYQVYVKDNYVTIKTSAADDEATIKPSTDSTLGGDASYDGTDVTGQGFTGKTSLDVGLYDTPSASGTMLGTIPADTVVSITGVPSSSNGWYRVVYNSKTGYVPATMLQLVADDEEKDEPVTIVALGEIVNTNGVNFRKGPGTGYDSMAKLKSGELVEIITIPKGTTSAYWYYVRYEGELGYIQAPYVKVMGEEEEATDAPTEEPEKAIDVGIIVNTNGVNLRKGPGTGYDSMGKLTANTVVEVLAIPEKFDSNHWFKVRYQGTVGYIQAPYVRVPSMDGEDEATEEPTEEPTVAPEDEIIIGYGVIVNTNGVNFRKGPGTGYDSMAKLKSGEVVELITIPEKFTSAYWFKVRYQDQVGYIQAPYVSVPGQETEDPTAAPDDEEEVEPKYTGVIVNTNGVNFRKGPGTSYDSMAKLKSGVLVDVLDVPEAFTSAYWFKVRYQGQIGYIQAPYVSVSGVTDVETEEPTEAPTPEWDEDVVGIGMITSTNGVNFRQYASVSATSLGQLTAGTTVQLLKIPSGTDSSYWFKIRYNGKDGYVQAPYVVVLQGESPDSDNDSDILGVGAVTSSDGVNFRTGPGRNYPSMGKLAAETNVELLSIPATVGDDHWYLVRYNGKKGYIQSPYIRVVTITADALPDVAEYGYAQLQESSANLRDSAGGSTVVTWKGKGSLLRITGEAVASGYYEWVPVYYPADSAIYYVRADMVQMVTVVNGEIVTPTPGPSSIYGYVITTGQGVNLRILPDEASLAQIPRGTVLTCVGDPVEPSTSSYTWYEVYYKGMTGYVRGDNVSVCDSNGNVEDSATPAPDDDDEYTVYGYIKVTPLTAGNRVNLRDKPAGSRIGLLDADLILPMVDEKITEGVYGQYSWYKVRTADGLVGYVRGDCAVECDEDGDEIEATPTPAPTETIQGYVQITGNNVYLRKEPFGVALTQMSTGTVWPIVGKSQESNEITWYNITANGKTGYVHGDYAYQLTDEQVAVWKATGVVPEISMGDDEELTNYVITVNTRKLNLRASYSQDSDSVYQVGSGVVMEFIATKQVGTVTWYNIIYKDIELWAHGDYLEQMTVQDYKAYLAQNPDFVPDEDDNLGYVYTVQNNVYIRNAANGSNYIDKITTAGTIMRYYAEGISAGNYTWYRILTPDGEFGYVRSDLVKKCDADGNDISNGSTEIGTVGSVNQSQQETSYSTLKYGDSGTAVLNLVTELKNQGYYTGSLTSNYTSAVKAAVQAFQRAAGLDVDGVAGSATQHALFGTVPIGTGNTDNLDFVIYPAEKIDWFDGGIQEMLPRGANFKVYDVKTGIVWWAHRWAGAYHADIETLTLADSKRLCEIYGVSSLAEIVKENMWQRRPCLVTIGTRTFACSLDGMQHNPDGDTISNNGMDGQICLHFTNSTGHADGAGVSESHAEAIEYAYKNAPNGQK